MSILKKLFKLLQSYLSPLIVPLFVGHIVFFIILSIKTVGALQGLELSIYDLLLWTQSVGKPTDSRIIMVWSTDEDQRRWGWPLPDEDLAQLLEIILANEPKAVGLDIYRDLPVPRSGGPGYERLTQLFKNNKKIVVVKKHRDDKGVRVEPPPALKGTQQVGFNDIPTDPGGVIRRGLLYLSDPEEQKTLQFFGLELVLRYLSSLGIRPRPDPNNPRALVLGKASLIPIDSSFGGYVNADTGGFQFMLDYPGAPTKFHSVTGSQILSHQVEGERFRDKIVIIGVNAEATPDFTYIPFDWLGAEQRVPGAAIHAYITSQLLRMALGESQPIESWSEIEEILWIWIWTIASALICIWAHSVWRLTLCLVSGLLFLVFCGYLLFVNNMWILIAAPAIGWITSTAIMIAYSSNQEKQQRTVLMQLFSKHVSKEVAQVIWQEREQYLNSGRLLSQRLTATVLFTDLQNFTTISEQMEPQALMEWLNRYMEAMVTVVIKHNGQVNKFIGDAVMAIFGAPIPSSTYEAISRDATNAVKCALAMRREIERLREIWRASGLPLIRMRIGIFTGPVIAGSLGGVERQEYTVIGDTVNTASRLESFDKSVDTDSVCRILIGESTLQYLNNQFQTERVGEVHLKGKVTAITVYRVVAQLQASDDIPQVATLS